MLQIVNMAKMEFWHAFLFIYMIQLLLLTHGIAKKTDGANLVETIIDAKDLKKLLRTKNNVLVLYIKNAKEGTIISKAVSQVAEQMKGQATLALVDCGGEGKKLCKKLKVTPEPAALKHYKNGEFHKDYDRKLTVQSMVNFLKDPSGDMPWEEDENAKDVIHISDANTLGKLLHREKNPVMVMFYAPWCGFCKRLKPDYEVVATQLKGHSVLAAMDVNKPENAIVRKHFNISGFPTLLYFESGNLKLKYDGENNKESLLDFLRNPTKLPEKPKDAEWSDTPSDVVHLTESTFDSEIQAVSSALVMFYAPWCGHCKKMKPEFMTAAENLREKEIPGILAAVDVTKEKSIGDRYKITGYPTVKYFKDGEVMFDVNFRTADKIEEFMLDPKEPPPPPPPEIPWSQVSSNVVHLTEEDFKLFLKRKKHVLLMFYAPWCGHCKKAKPEFEGAAAYFKDDPKVELAAIDCTAHSGVCNFHDIKGYPTLKYFSYYKIEKSYDGRREESDFVEYMKAMVDGKAVPSPPPPPSPEQWWSELPGGEKVKLLTSDNFESTLLPYESSLVMFYAPWCGHCKLMKPAYAEAATTLQELNANVVLAAVDATVERTLAAKYEVKGFPTVKYFRKGEFVSDYDKQRTADDIVSFMMNTHAAKEEL